MADELAQALEAMQTEWSVWSASGEALGVDFLLGRGAIAHVFGTFFPVPFDLHGCAGCVVPYTKVAKAQSLAAAMNAKAVLVLGAADGLWFASLTESAAGTIERPVQRETWPAAAQGGAPLAYRVLGSALKPLRRPNGR
jgi:hypothetical protein